MSQNLNDIKQKLAGEKSGLRTNRFSIDLTLWNPPTGRYTSINGYPAAAVSSPSTAIQSALFEYQNIPLQIPVKRQNTNQLVVTFYTTEDLEVYSTLMSLIKKYGGEPSFGDGNAPTVFNFNNMYNRAIRGNTLFVNLISAKDGKVTNHLRYSGVYPVNIIPIEFNSTENDRIGTFSVVFNFAFTTTDNEGNA